MANLSSHTTRLLLIGKPGSAFRLAASMAVDAGAEVAVVDSVEAGIDVMRDAGADLAMIDIGAGVGDFMSRLRRERMALAVYACGVDVPAAAAVAAIRAGARDYLPLPPDRELIAAAILSVVGHTPTLIGKHPAFDRARELGLALAPARTPFLITGPPGSGRELLARTVHAASGRPGKFVRVDCVEADPLIIESELFGYRAGTFPGAIGDRRGRIDLAANGTLFLDEVAMLPLATQTRLAELLDAQGRNVAGAVVPARVIASTAFDLEARVNDGRFRGALLAQLGLVRLALPPLCQRGTDIALLAEAFASRFADSNNLPVRPFTEEALALLRQHDWPGNVGELEDVVHRAILVSHDDAIPASALMVADGSRLGSAGGNAAAKTPRNASAVPGRLDSLVGSKMEDVERALILETLKACRGNRTSASTILGISVRTMRNKLKTFIEAGIAV